MQERLKSQTSCAMRHASMPISCSWHGCVRVLFVHSWAHHNPLVALANGKRRSVIAEIVLSGSAERLEACLSVAFQETATT